MMHFSTVSTSQLKHFQLKVLWCTDVSDKLSKNITVYYSNLRDKIQVLDWLLIKHVSGTIQKCPPHRSLETKE